MIAEKLYRQIHREMPIICIDLVIVRRGAVLLVKRKTEPAAGKFWIPGGRLMKNEAVHLAGRRLALNEVGLVVGSFEFLDYMDCYFEADPFGHGGGTHTVSLVFGCEIVRTTREKVRLDVNHSRSLWWNGLGDHLDIPNVLEAIIKKGLKRLA